MEAQRVQTNEETLQFININDDCFYKIFEYLSTSDLCSTSFTCKRLQTLTQDYFGRRYSNECISIDISLNGRGNTELEFSKTDANKVLKYFGKSIQNVRMRSSMRKIERIDLGLLYHFLKNECCRELHSIELNLSCDIQLNSLAEDDTRIQFRSVESVKITDVESVQSTYDGLLQLCANLKRLEIATPADNVYEWLQYVYPNLETLSLPWVHRRNPESIRDFLQNHQQLKDITCEGIHLRNPRFRNFENIHRLEFRTACSDELINIIQLLKNNDSNKMITFFGVKLGICYGSIGSVISDLNAIQPINKLEYDADWQSFQIPYMEHLHELNVNEKSIYSDVNQEHTPNLKSLELSYSFKLRLSFRQFELIAKPILQSLWQLKSLSFVFKYLAAYHILSQTNLNELEAIRRGVHGASNIDFHFYFGFKSNRELPPNLVSSGNTLTVNYHFQHDLYKFEDILEYSVAEVTFGVRSQRSIQHCIR